MMIVDAGSARVPGEWEMKLRHKTHLSNAAFSRTRRRFIPVEARDAQQRLN